MKQKFFKIGLAVKFIILITALIILTSSILSLFFINRQSADLLSSLKEKGILLARNLAYISEYGVLTSSKEPLEKLLKGVLREPDIAYAMIYNIKGDILADSMKDGLYQIPDSVTTIALNCQQDQFVFQEFRIAGENTGFYEIAFPIVARRLKGLKKLDKFVPGYLGIMEQLKKYVNLSGEIFEEQIGIARVGLTKKHVIAAVSNVKRTVGIITLSVVFLGMTLTIIIVRIIVTPIKRLVQGTRQLSSGNLAFKVAVTSSDEIGELTKSFNSMIGSLKKYNEQIEEYSRTLEEKVLERTKKLKEKELELIRYEKFDAIVEFITGMTHELNNKLTPILGYIQIFRALGLGEEIDQYIEVMEDSAMNAKHIVESLLKYSRPVPPKKEYIQLNETMQHTIGLIEPTIRMQGIKLETTLDSDIPKTMADESQISQVFLNILNNACQAIEKKEHGIIAISSGMSVEKNILFCISDNGTGIPEENLTKIFDPFFSTKEVGKGTGLGLSVTYGIIQGHEGTIRVGSEPGKGCTFEIELPVKKDTSRKIINDKKISCKTIPRKGSILVIDDDHSVRSVIKDALKKHHTITLAASVEEAKKIIKKTTFDVYFIDLRMPGATGQHLFTWLTEQFEPEIEKTVFITADTFDKKTKTFLDHAQRPRLIKPFHIETLFEAVNEILAQ